MGPKLQLSLEDAVEMQLQACTPPRASLLLSRTLQAREYACLEDLQCPLPADRRCRKTMSLMPITA